MPKSSEAAVVESDTDATVVTVLGRSPAKGAIPMRRAFVPYRGPIALGFVILLITNALALTLPRLIKDGVDLVEHESKHTTLLAVFGIDSASVGVIVIAIVLISILGGVFRVLSRIVLFNVGRDVERDLRSLVFSHLATLSPTFFRANAVGDLMSRLTNDLTNIRLMAGFALLNIINAVLIFFTTLPLLFLLDVKTALFALAPFPLVMGAAQLLARTMYQRTRANQERLGELTSHLQENLAGQHVVRAFSQEEQEISRFHDVNERVFQTAMKLASIRVVFFPLMGLMSALGIAIALYVGGLAVVDGRMTTGDVVEFNARLLQLTWPAIAMGFIISVYQRGKAGLDRINELLRERPDIVDGSVHQPIVGLVEARQLGVTFPGESREALAELSFRVAPGEVLGVVGRNASGKSTLVRALARLVPVDSGKLFVDDVDANDWHRSALHSGLAVVTDDGFLFSASLRDNITFARGDATDDDVAHAVSVADLSRDIETFPEGLSTMVGERGVTLSGGQKQRVALARALLARPRILVLDDSLSAVDAETESRIVEALRAGRFSSDGSPPTLIVISHRLSAVREAKEIIVLDDGHVVQRGVHDDLVKEVGLYAELWGTEQLKKRLGGATS